MTDVTPTTPLDLGTTPAAVNPAPVVSSTPPTSTPTAPAPVTAAVPSANAWWNNVIPSVETAATLAVVVLTQAQAAIGHLPTSEAAALSSAVVSALAVAKGIQGAFNGTASNS